MNNVEPRAVVSSTEFSRHRVVLTPFMVPAPTSFCGSVLALLVQALPYTAGNETSKRLAYPAFERTQAKHAGD